MDNCFLNDQFLQILTENLKNWQNVKSKTDLEISVPGGFTGTTFLLKNKLTEKSINNPVILKLHIEGRRPGLQKEMKFAEILSEQGWGPEIYFQCDQFRIERFLELIPMGIYEMRNPYYMSSIVQKLVEFEHNSELNKFLTEFYKGKKQTLLMEFKDAIYPKFQTKIEQIEGYIGECDDDIQELFGVVKREYYDQNQIAYLERIFKEDITSDSVRVSHYDVQQGNILKFAADQSKIIIIDYEDPLFAPTYLGLGSFLGSIMRENSHPEGYGVKFYPDNAITEREIRFCRGLSYRGKRIFMRMLYTQ
ncbi:UNKNOWN [Stylonychia lemnae]|uniref:Aminoglycoside phosphotransferase domain-containing protein n=1 Tax=Stylonychia lemnae TaxID=5949 RepID=A0A077ZU76_STYLE|nr:UNKNOWN [Stylonychia lemnae]|eukprot:CDW72016.1 UNKNOWN [Stylonychia lemnae]